MTITKQQAKEGVRVRPPSRRDLEIPLECLIGSPHQMRYKGYEKQKDRRDADESLAHSLKRDGLFHPVEVRTLNGGKYEIITGHRRVAAARKIGWETIRCDIYDDLDELTAAYMLGRDNFERVQIYPYEKGIFFRFWQKRIGIDEASLLFHCAPRTISHWVAVADGIDLITLPFSEREREVFIERITDDILNTLLQIKSEPDLEKAARMVVEKKADGKEYTTEEIKQFAADSNGSVESTRVGERPERDPVGDLKNAVNDLERELSSKGPQDWVSQTMRPIIEARQSVLEEFRSQQEFIAQLNRGLHSFKVKKPGEVRVKHEFDLQEGVFKCIHIAENGKPIGTISGKLKATSKH